MQPIGEGSRQAFPETLTRIYTGAVLTSLIEIGCRTGLFDAAAEGPGTSHRLAERAGLEERYVREWLGGMTTGGIFLYDPTSQTYTLPPEHAAFLSGETARNLAPMSKFLNHLGRQIPNVTRAFRHGGGVPYSEYGPDLLDCRDDLWRRIYDEHLIAGFLPVAKGLPERLADGIRVADIGCGTGRAIVVMAREYPRSTFVGYDIAGDAIARAAADASAVGLANASFAALDAARLPAEPKFDLITAFDAIHDQAQPATVLGRICEALAPDGVFLMIDFKFSSNLEENVGNPFAPISYGISTMHCMTVSLAEGGAGLGTVWGIQLACRMLAEAGFISVEVFDSPRPQNCIFVCRK